jgi:7 transmembrane receptor (rhodopsin family)
MEGLNDSNATLFASPGPPSDPMAPIRFSLSVVYVVLFLLGLSNFLVLFFIAKHPRMRTVTNVYIFNLCAADVVFILFLPLVVSFLLGRNWYFGKVVCKLFYAAESTAKYASVYFVTTLSVDRYLAICAPRFAGRARTVPRSGVVSLLGWVVVAGLMTPVYWFSTVVQVSADTYLCTVDPSGVEPYFTAYTFAFTFAAPAAVILACSVRVVVRLSEAAETADRLKKRPQPSHHDQHQQQQQQLPHRQQDQQQTKKSKKSKKTGPDYRKVTRLVLAMTSFYLCCWTPYWLMNLMVTFGVVTMTTGHRIVFLLIHALPYFNCALNPVIYALMNEQFYELLKESALCSVFRRRVSQEAPVVSVHKYTLLPGNLQRQSPASSALPDALSSQRSTSRKRSSDHVTQGSRVDVVLIKSRSC